MTDEAIVLTGPDQTMAASWLALRSALKIELGTGMQLSRGRSASKIATDRLKAEGKIAEGKRPNKLTVYKILNAHIVEMLGEGFDRPYYPKAVNEHG